MSDDDGNGWSPWPITAIVTQTRDMDIILTGKNEELYDRIKKSGDIEMMFELGYIIGQEHMAKEQLKKTEELVESFKK